MNLFIRIFYNIALFVVSFIYLIKYMIKGRAMRDLMQRFYIPKIIKSTLAGFKVQPIWFHAVSVGEINVLATFLKQYKNEHPLIPIVVSTITPTGYDAAILRLAKFTDCLFYFPIDFAPVVRNFCKIINPAKFIAMETELWPELFCQLNRRGTKICILNGRLSDKSYPSYFKYRNLLKPVLRCIDTLGAQNSIMQERFVSLGLTESKVTVTGNIKYAIERADDEILALTRKKWEFLNGSTILAASTHEPEEEYIIEVFKKLKSEFKNINLIICPRHIERCSRIARICHDNGFKTKLYSNFSGDFDVSTIYIIDQVGILSNLYSVVDLAIVGGSFINHGGQNILEAAIHAKPIIFGPYMHNFKDIAEQFVDKRAAIQLNDNNQLYAAIKDLLTNVNYARKIGDNAFDLISNASESVKLSSQLVNSLD